MRIYCSLALVVMMVGCGSETIVHKLDEREANKIIELLAEGKVPIKASKGMVDTGREIYFTISVPASQRLEAIRILNQNELPSVKDKGYDRYGEEGGLIPTNTEERAKFLAAIEGEIQRQLRLIDGILEVQVQVVIPPEDQLRTTEEKEPDTTASVTIKYMPTANGSKPLSEPQVQAIVAAGVEKLTSDKVVVVMTPGRGGAKRRVSEPRTTTTTAGLTGKQLRIVAGGGVGFILLLSLGLIYAQLRLRSVRGRLIRLQTEIAKARRKPGDSQVSQVG